MRPPATCHPDREHLGRGLCRPCWSRAKNTDTLYDHPRATRSRADLLADWRMLRGQGHTKRQIAERLGMTFRALDQALVRARRDGALT